MKSWLSNSMFTFAAILLASCTAGLQVNKTSSWDDEIYGNTKPKTTKVEVVSEQHAASSEKQQQYRKMDGKFAEALKALEDSSKNDTVIYKAEDPNPYRRILSDSYQESYERRLKGFEDPRYGMEDWSIYYSDDWRYAQAYDPSYYRVVVMGSNVWVEPWYIYNTFGWPRTRFYYGFGFGWGYNPWNSFYLGYYWDPWYYNPWYYSPWYYSPYVAGNAYWSGWYNATYYWDKYTPNSNRYYYGRRGNTTNNTDQYVGGRSTSTIPADGQIVTSRRTRTDVPADNTNPVVTTRETQTRVTPTYETRRGEGRTSTTGNQTVVRRDGASTRVSNGTGDFSSSRTTRPTREIGISEPTRRGTTPTYDRPRTGNSGEYNSTRRVENPSTQPNITRSPSSSTPARTTTPTYNRPNRVSTPSSSQPSTRSYNNEHPRSSSSGSSGNSSVSRSSSSNSSGSSSSSSSNSSGTSTTRRR